VDPVPDPLLLRKCGCAGKRTQDLWIYIKSNSSIQSNVYLIYPHHKICLSLTCSDSYNDDLTLYVMTSYCWRSKDDTLFSSLMKCKINSIIYVIGHFWCLICTKRTFICTHILSPTLNILNKTSKLHGP
jgi:hypothetical protein